VIFAGQQSDRGERRLRCAARGKKLLLPETKQVARDTIVWTFFFARTTTNEGRDPGLHRDQVAACFCGNSGQTVKACEQMNNKTNRKRLLAAGTSGASIMALTFLPKCPLCLVMWLSAIGFTSLFSKLTVGAAGSVFMAVVLLRFFSGIRKSPAEVSNDATAPGGKQSTHRCCE